MPLLPTKARAAENFHKYDPTAAGKRRTDIMADDILART